MTKPNQVTTAKTSEASFERRFIMAAMLAKKSKVELIRMFGRLTMNDVLDGSYPALSGLSRTYGREKVESALAVLVVEAASYFAEPISKESALVIAAEITTEYYWFSLEDVYIVLQGMKRKPMYGKLTPHKVLTELNEYREERLNAAAKRREEEHMRRFQRRTRDPNDQADAVRMREAIRQELDRYHEPKKPKK